MNKKEIETWYKQTNNLLEANRLVEAMTQLDAALQDSKLYRLSARLDEVRTAYGYMLQYMRQGMTDDNRPLLFARLKNMLWVLLEQTYLWQLDQVSTSFYHTKRKVMAGGNGQELDGLMKTLTEFPDELAVCPLMPTANQQQILRKHETAGRDLFLNIWCNSGWTTEEHALVQQALEEGAICVSDQCLLVSAITLSLMQCVDPLKLSLLAETCHHKEVQVSQRALVGIALVSVVSPGQVNRHADSLISLSTIFDTRIAEKLNTIYVQLLRAQGTESVDKKMREEIIPEMIKNVGHLNKFGYPTSENDDDEEARNPDWENEAQTKFEEKIREMGELQQAGADVYLSTFAALKSYPFFHELPNWFLPFHHTHSSVVDIFGLDGKAQNKLLVLLLHSGMFCNSDKFSLCFTMNLMPQEGREQLLAQLTDQGIEVLEDEQRLLSMKQYTERPEVVSNSYIQDLYRFFKLYPRRKEFKNPFLENIALHRLPFFEEQLNNPNLLKQVADLLFQQEKYEEFSAIYCQLQENLNGEDSEIINADFYRKMGYCLQKQKKYNEAIEYYERADLMQANHLWTLRRLATCLRLQKKYDKAIDCYRQIEAMQPENIQVLLQIAACYANRKQYDDALSYLKKADFLEPENPKVWRAMMWCYFLKGNNEQASNYIEQILQTTPDAVDYLNAGHVAWVMNRVGDAAEYYRKAAKACESREQFIELFDKDIPTLREHHKSPEEIALMKELTLD